VLRNVGSDPLASTAPGAPPPPPPAALPPVAPPPAAPTEPLNESQQKLGRVLLAAGGLTHEALERQLEKAGKLGSVLGKALLQSGYAREEDILAPLVRRHRVPRINLKTTKIPLETIALLDVEIARRLRFLPLDEVGDILVVVTPDIFNAEAVDELRRATKRRLSLIQCSEEGFEKVLETYYQKLAESQPPKPPPPPPAAERAPEPRAAAPAAAPAPAAHAPLEPGAPLRALPASAEEVAAARPLDGARGGDREALWDWTFAGPGPVRAEEALL
jgi:hypothetical protein